MSKASAWTWAWAALAVLTSSLVAISALGQAPLLPTLPRLTPVPLVGAAVVVAVAALVLFARPKVGQLAWGLAMLGLPVADYALHTIRWWGSEVLDFLGLAGLAAFPGLVMLGAAVKARGPRSASGQVVVVTAALFGLVVNGFIAGLMAAWRCFTTCIEPSVFWIWQAMLLTPIVVAAVAVFARWPRQQPEAESGN